MSKTENPRAIQAPNYTPKERVNKTKQVCEAYQTGKHSLGACIESAGLKRRTFDQWVGLGKKDIAAGKKIGRYSYAKCADLLNKAKQQRAEKFKAELKDRARTGLEKLITGYEREETRTIIVSDKDGNPTVKEKIVTTKHTAPNATAVIFALTNVDADNFKHKNDLNLGGELDIKSTGLIKLPDGSTIEV